jgi:hypothetical protein
MVNASSTAHGVTTSPQNHAVDEPRQSMPGDSSTSPGKAVATPQGAVSQALALKQPTSGNQVGPGPQQAAGIRVAGSSELHGAAEIWTGRNATGLYGYLVTRTVSVPLGRITEQSLALAKQGSTPINRGEDFYGAAKLLMADPGLSGRDYTAGNVEIVADFPATQAELTAPRSAFGRVPSYNRRVHDVMAQAGLAPDPRDGRTYTLPATRLGGQRAARIFFDQPPGQMGALNGMADAKRLFPGAPKAFIDGFNESKTGFFAANGVIGGQLIVTSLAGKGGAKVLSAKLQNQIPNLNTRLSIPGAGISRLTPEGLGRALPTPRTTGQQNKPVTLRAPEAEAKVPVRPNPSNNGARPPSGGNPSRPSSGTPKAASKPLGTPLEERNPFLLGNGQQPSSGNMFSPNPSSDAPGSSALKRFEQYAQGVNKESQPTRQLIADLQREQAQNNTPGSANAYPGTQAPTPQAPVIKPGEPARIGGVSAKVIGDGGNLKAAFAQATARTREDNARGTDVSLAYPVKDQGVYRLHEIQNISPTEARTLLYQIEQRGQLAAPRKDVFLHNGIGGRSGNGSVVTPEQDLQQREAGIFFDKLTPQQIVAKVQANALKINGKQSTVLHVSKWGETSRLCTEANSPSRWRCSASTPCRGRMGKRAK